MNLLDQLSKILDSRSELLGTVISIDIDSAAVATSRGTVYCSINIQTQLRVGSKVRIKNGMIVGLIRESAGNSKIYIV